MKRLELTAKIKTNNGKDIIEYHDKDFKEKIDNWKSKNSGSTVVITFEAQDIKRHGQFKYYWGYLLPDCAFLAGENDQQYYHRYFLKKRHLFNPVETFMEIPARYREKCVVYTEIRPVFDADGEPVMLASGEVELKEKIVGYAPSLADISNEERGEFIKKVEMEFFTDQQGHIGVRTENQNDLQHQQTQAKKYRDQGFGQDPGQASLFGEEVNNVDEFKNQHTWDEV